VGGGSSTATISSGYGQVPGTGKNVNKPSGVPVIGGKLRDPLGSCYIPIKELVGWLVS
jgi:hypothetical protein